MFFFTHKTANEVRSSDWRSEVFSSDLSCNRARLTCTGTLDMFVGPEDAADRRTPLRQSEGDELLEAAILEAIGRKPKGHDFIIDRRRKQPAVSRHMSVTGG